MHSPSFLRNIFIAAVSLSLLGMCFQAGAQNLPSTQSTLATETPAHRDARMAWWRVARFGMFIHWGLYSVPAGVWQGKDIDGIGEWILHNGRIPVADYKALAPQFNPTDFDADAWVSLAKEAGMKYIVITTKHHDGFAMFHSKVNPFNIYDATPFKRDPLKELAKACNKQGIKLGFYYSQDQDWTAPGGAALLGGHWDPKAQDGDFATYLKDKAIPQMQELLNNYKPYPAVIWFDTPTPDMTPELAGKILALLKDHPQIIWNNRLGGGDRGDTETPEQTIPANGFPGRDWETCMTINDTWGYKSKDTNFKSTETLLRNLIDIASKGGNYLLNVGPTSKGVIPQPEADRLLAIGAWLKVNGEAIYGTTASPFKRQLSWGRVTQKPGKLYLEVFDWPKDGKLPLPISNTKISAHLLASAGKLDTVSTPDGWQISLPSSAPDPIASVIEVDLDGPALPISPVSATQAPDGSITLNAAGADLSGVLHLENDPPNIGSWTKVGDSAVWTVKVTHPGSFKVSLNYALDPSSKGSEAEISTGGSSVSFDPEITGSWSNYEVGDAPELLKIPSLGIVQITVFNKLNPGIGLMNLRGVTLTPAGT